MQEQLAASIWATVLLFPSLCIAIVMDLDILHWDIFLALFSDPIATKHISTDGQWFMDPNSLLFFDNRIYVLSASNLHTRVLQYNHDHILAGYFGQNKTLKLVHYRYSWLSLHADVQQFYKSCVCNPCYNVTSPIDLSNNFLSLNDYGILFSWTLLRNFCHPPSLTLSWS